MAILPPSTVVVVVAGFKSLALQCNEVCLFGLQLSGVVSFFIVIYIQALAFVSQNNKECWAPREKKNSFFCCFCLHIFRHKNKIFVIFFAVLFSRFLGRHYTFWPEDKSFKQEQQKIPILTRQQNVTYSEKKSPRKKKTTTLTKKNQLAFLWA